MTVVVTSYNNFARAKIDHDMMGRYDLPIYQTGADVFRNYISNFKGNAIYRSGFESMVAFQDCVFIEFKFNSAQNYLCVFYANKIRFLSYDSNGNFGWVLDGAMAILEVATPYTLAECRELDYSENADVMVISHPNYDPRKLVRVSANNFTFNTYARLDDPFGLTYAATKAITGITQAVNAVVTSAAHGYTTGQMVKFSGIVGMTQLNNWTARVTVINANSYSIDVDTTTFTAYGSGGTSAQVLTGDYPACCLFYKGRLYFAASRLKITTVWSSEVGFYDRYTLPVTVTDTSALRFTIADISQKIEWLFPGDNSLIVGSADGIVAVNGGGVGTPITASTIEATLTSANGCNGAYPTRKDGLVWYIGLDGRNLYSFSYDLLTESFIAQDANLLSYDITLGGLTKIRYKKDRNDLLLCLRGDGALTSLNFKDLRSEVINGWHEAETYGLFKDEAVITDNTGKPQLFVLALRNGVYYIERQAEYLEFVKRVDFFTPGEDGTRQQREQADEEAYIRLICEQLKQCNFLDNSQEISNLQANPIIFDGIQSLSSANPVFSPSDVGKHIVYKTLTGYESGRFQILGYVSSILVTVAVLQEPTSNTYTDWYLTFSSITGLSQYTDQTISVVTDGGYLSDFFVSGTSIALPDQVTHARVGYKYRGIIKSFCLGFQVGAKNTQGTMKAIKRAGFRLVASAGGKFGSTPYRLEDIQDLNQNDINYLPPKPIDGTKFVTLVDDNEEDKFFYAVQDEPLPQVIAAVLLETNYVVA